MKNILLVDGGVSFGGSLIVVARLANHLDRKKYRPIVISSTPLADINHHFKDHVKVYSLTKKLNYVTRGRLNKKIKNFPLVFKKALVYSYSLIEFLANIGYYIRINSIILNEKIDLVHGNNNLEPIFLSWILRIPRVWHFHGFVGTDKMHRKIVNLSNCFISISFSVSDSIHKKNYIKDKKLLTIHNPLGDEVWYQEEDKNALKKRLGITTGNIVGVFGRLVAWKGQKEFLEAFSLVLKTHPDTYAIIVGDDSEYGEYGRQLIDKVENLGIRKNVIFCGFVKETSLYYQICDIVVHCSIEPEPFGLVISEAMQNKVALVASTLGAGPELVSDAETGLLADPRTPDDLASKIAFLLQNPKTREKMAAKAYQFVTEQMDPKKYALQISKECYEKLL